MGWLVMFPLLLLLAFVGWRVGKGWLAKSKDETVRSSDQGDYKVAGVGAYAVGGLALGGAVLLTALSTLYAIPAGHVGVIKTFGGITGQTGDGLTMVAPWSSVSVVSTQVQRQHFQGIAAFSKETQDVFIDATLNLSVSPGAVQNLYRTVGADWFDKLVPPRVNQTVKDETVKFLSVNIAPNRETIRKDVRDRLEAQLAQYSIHVQDFLLDNITFPKDFTDAILRKQVATQDAQTAQNRIKVSEAQASQVAAAAKGDAQATLIKATAQAKANHLLNQSLSTNLIQFTAVQKLAPGVKTILLPSNSNFILPSSVTGN